jgi:hypothetical protein
MDHKQGDRRADGYRFLSYEKRDGRFREKWASPERFAKAIQFMRDYRTNYRKGSK